MSKELLTGEVLVEVQDQVSWITFSHPQHNSMPASQLAKLTDIILQEGINTDSKLILLQSSGDRTFCAGANFQELASITSVPAGKDFFLGFANLLLAIRDCRKLVIGRVQGKGVGGGVGLLAATDYCLASKWASVRLSELSIGIGPYVIEPAITRKVGKAGFSQLALNPTQWQTAQWAHRQGLYQGFFDDINQLDGYLRQYLQNMVSYSNAALQQMKLLLWEGTESWPILLEERAQKSAELLMMSSTQKMINSYLAP